MASKHLSDAVDERQIGLARETGEAYYSSLEYLVNEVAHAGGIQEVQDLIVGFSQEQAEGMYTMNATGELEWDPPDEENCHIAVAVMDREDRRFLPYCDIAVTLFDGSGTEYGPFSLPFVWHPGLFHYGRNIQLPGNGIYDVHIQVNPPAFDRHDKKNGVRYTQPVEVVFENTDIRIG